MSASAPDVAAAATQVLARFDDDYWRAHCRDGRHPDEMWAELARADLLGLGLPTELGGTGLGLAEAAVLVETTARAGRPLFSLLTTYICGELLLRHGSPRQQKEYLPKLADGTLRFAFAITEPDAGTNSFAIRTTVRPADEGLSLSGHKHFISGADQVDRVI